MKCLAVLLLVALASALPTGAMPARTVYYGELTVAAHHPNGDLARDCSTRVRNVETRQVAGTASLGDGYAVIKIRAAGTYVADILDRRGNLKATSEPVTFSDSVTRAKVLVALPE
jgi:hypothetical protein